MTCRTHPRSRLTVRPGPGNRAHRRAARPRPCQDQPDLSGAERRPGPELQATADLVLRVASIIPPPSPDLRFDQSAWRAFDSFLGESARLVAHTLGTSSAPALRALMQTALADDAVTGLLLQRALEALDDH